ncbi:MAG: hypothetical protein RIE73_14655 [Coleofasciculus sp. C1-SOL-03]
MLSVKPAPTNTWTPTRSPSLSRLTPIPDQKRDRLKNTPPF